jgi:outer membrane protein insertion porin family
VTRNALLLAVLAAGCGGSEKAPVRSSLPAQKEQLGPPARLEDLKGNLVSVSITGMSAERTARAREKLGSAVGKPYDRFQIGKDIRFLFLLAGIADVVVEGRPTKGGVALRFLVREQPRIRSVDVRGSHAIPASEWLSRLQLKEGEYLDPSAATTRRRMMVETLRSFGHFSADVKWTADKAKDGQVDLVFTVEEGPSVVLSKIELKGNKVVKKDKLLDLLATHGGTKVGARYWREALANALMHVTSHYYDNGHINVVVDNPVETLSADRASMSVAISIKEGDRFRLGKLDAKGDLVAPVGEYLKLLGVKKGEIFNRSKLGKGLERIGEMHTSKGQPSLAVYPTTEIDPKKKTVAITVTVQKN